MSFGTPKTPKLTPPPPPPDPTLAQQALEIQRKRGLGSTLLTGTGGVPDAGGGASRKTLLGQ